ncbi:expressed unknown protein [Seminavis robusta]|uniref:BTB domain-containing protein n=1 Tax=Seminavis robusta TaxID=568900 RepID=A0A9N8HPY9_9STRA|nr:expressed unknown protein [Seminavis robusta]|eukprot:Sro1379_g267691.1  (443) ;mRNA; r:12642-13970
MVPANRIALSVRSEYFKTLFKKDGQFKESTDAVVSIGFSSDVLEAVVEYIHTDAGILLAKYSEDATGISSKDATGASLEISNDCMEEFQALVSLTEAAMYVGLTGLCQKAQKCLTFFMKMEPLIAIAILAASKQAGPVVSEELVSRAWSMFCGVSGEFHNAVLGRISATVLGAILQDAKAKLDNMKLFELIHTWSTCEPVNADRQNSATALVQNYVDLECIDPDDLASLVETSSLVTTGQLLDAYKKQAKKAKHHHKIAVHKPLYHNVEWKFAQSKALTTSARNVRKSDIFNGAAFALGGKYRWTVTTNSNSGFWLDDFWLGVTKSTHSFKPDKFCGRQAHCWGVYGHNGYEYSNKKSVCRPLGEAAKFGDGSCVTMTLDLSSGAPGNGTLSISVNDQDSVVAVSDLRTHLVGDLASLVPAVSCSNGSATIEDVQMLCMGNL